MKLKDLLLDLWKLEQEGHGEKEVFCVRGSSGCVCELGSCSIDDYVGECGPYDLKPNEEYISIYGGN